ncbi:MAG: glycosyltransferase family 39 protein [Acidobacteriota bacterium]|nr:glycosyltransferase family 39 protein [Acidobacteriota bacterium]
MSGDRMFWPILGLIVCSVGWLEVRSVRDETQTWDEGIHISAGYAYLTRGDYSWNPEHPPLVKMLAAMPLLGMGLETRPYDAAGKRQDQVHFGIDFLYHNRRDADTILFAARRVPIGLSLLFVAAMGWWARRRWGTGAGLLAAALAGFDPNLVAHGRYVTTDVPEAACFFFACVLWVEYLERRGTGRLLAAAGMFALAMVVKFSAVLLAPALVLLFGIEWLRRPREFGLGRAAVAAGALAGVLLVTVAVVYWPETVRCWKARGAAQAAMPAEDATLLTGAMRVLHLPQHTFLLGLNDVVFHNQSGHESYLMGIRSQKGLWQYFPVVFAVKSTLTALAALAVLLGAGVWWYWRGMGRPLRERARAIPPMALGLALPPAIYFGVSMTSAINLGMRHILPVYPFLYAGIAALLAQASWKRAARVAMVALAAGQIAECAWIAPDYLAFFNLASGGPGRGPQYLVDSNIDWGQDVKKLVHWLDAHHTRRARIYYFGNAQMAYYGIQEVGWPDPLDQQGWDAIDDYCVANVTPLYGVYAPLNALAPLRLREPVAKIGWSMYVYDLRKKK